MVGGEWTEHVKHPVQQHFKSNGNLHTSQWRWDLHVAVDDLKFTVHRLNG